VITLEFFLLILGAVVGGAVGFSYGRRSKPAVLQTNAADAVVWFLVVVNRDLPPEIARQVRAVAWENYDDEVQVYMKAKLREIQSPPPGNDY
jgi:hypothetical protein